MRDKLDKANLFVETNKQIVDKTYRHKFHLMGEVGWINDPNGFSVFNDEYHLFYQYHPFTSKWGPMYWGHAKSKDLITWEHLPIALAPLEDGTEGGAAFSGSALQYNNEHILMYTENWNKKQIQSIAKSVDGINYTRIADNPVISSKDLPKNASEIDFRDPKIWIKDSIFYSLISSRNIDSSGQLLLYKSSDCRNWDYISTVNKSDNRIGKMWECPDLFSLNNKDVLILSPQYLSTEGNKYSNTHSSIYMLGDFKDNKYIHSKMDEIDSGLDFYAPQTILDKKGRRIMISWMAMWERNMPTDDLGHNWAGAMTLPRELLVKEENLIQKPISEIEDYRLDLEEMHQEISKELDTKLVGDVCELDITINKITASEFGIKLFKGDKEETILSYSVVDSTLTFDRSNSGWIIEGNKERESSSNIRKVEVPLINGEIKLRVFLDKSSVEVFIQEGLKTMTALVYPKKKSKGIFIFANNGRATFKIKKWNLVR